MSEAQDHNAWRKETPGTLGWARSVWPDAKNKYLMVSTDVHINEPVEWSDSLSPEMKAMLPRVEVDEQGQKWSVIPGMRKTKTKLFFEDDQGEPEDLERTAAARSPEQVVADMDRDGIDIQIAYPNKLLTAYAMPDRNVMYAMCAAYNEWIENTYSVVKDRVVPMAMLPTADLDMTLQALDTIGKSGFFRGVAMPNKPIFGPGSADDPNYNLPVYDPLWEKLQDMNLAIAFHISTGKDPRGARGNGGAVINYACHSLAQSIEPVTNMCASGLLERFPRLRFATIESGIGWIPFALHAMDEAYRKHHMWVRPKLKQLPSEYFIEHGFASFQEDPIGLHEVQRDPRLAQSFMWANDYPHHEGCWPHSAPAIERQMSGLTESQREAILGGNAVKCFGLEDLARKRRY